MSDYLKLISSIIDIYIPEDCIKIIIQYFYFDIIRRNNAY